MNTLPAIRLAAHSRTALALVFLLLLSGCGIGRNYLELEGPRYGGAPSAQPAVSPRDTLRIVSFNIEFAFHVDSAIAVLEKDSALRNADVVLLQEMDAAATRQIAEKLGMWYVYYPATFHFRTRRDFGNAVLSRWPIVEDSKITLPNRSRYSNTLRTATAATIAIGAASIRLYSAHLGTYADVGGAARAEQLRAIAEDGKRFTHVVIAGDMNDPAVGKIMKELGYVWPTQHVPKTSILGRLDHIFLRGFDTPNENGAGTVLNVRGASDHLPVWAIAILPY